MQLEGCQQLLKEGLKPLDNRLDVLVNNAGDDSLVMLVACQNLCCVLLWA